MDEYEAIQSQAPIFKSLSGIAQIMALKCAVDLCLADVLHSHENPITLSQLASSIDSPTPLDISVLKRVMRTLVRDKIFTSHEPSDVGTGETRYSSTKASPWLLEESKMSLFPFVGITVQPSMITLWCHLLLECCSQERTYLRYHGLLGQRLCMINKMHEENFEKRFVETYSMIHSLETNKLRNVVKFFAHLLGTDALPWYALAYIRLSEENTTSSSRIFIKILFQELSEHLGIRLLNERLTDPAMQHSYKSSIFPRDNPKNTRFAINFFTSIGLGGITENLRELLEEHARPAQILF